MTGRQHFIMSAVRCVGALPQFDENVVKNEPMLFNCDLAGARRHGGPITNVFLHSLPKDWRQVPLVIDSRVHMLMPGWWPCIPGWHHDDVPRTREDGQPNYGGDQVRSQHIIALVNGDICPTEFALGNQFFDEIPLGRTVYEEWHREVEYQISRGRLSRYSAPSNLLLEFDDRSWHRGTQAKSTGWRFFIRASRYTDPAGNPVARGNKRTNEVRRQVQVYLSEPNAGW